MRRYQMFLAATRYPIISCLDDVRQDVVFNEGYSLTKYFGVSAYKRFTFHASFHEAYR